MKLRFHFWAVILLAIPRLAFCEPTTAPATKATGLSEQIQAAVLAWLDDASEHLGQLTPAAEAAVDELLLDGRFWAMGNGGFADEMELRIGGLPCLHAWPTDTSGRLQDRRDHDVFLFGQFAPNEPMEKHERLAALLVGGRFRGHMAVVFSSHKWPQMQRLLEASPADKREGRVFFIDTRAPFGASIQDRCVNEIATTMMAWAFQGEVIAAATRKGKTLATYASPWERDPQQTDKDVADLIVNPKYKLPPIEGGKIARQYFQAVREQLAPFAPNEAGKVRQAAARMAQCIKSGGVIWTVDESHIQARGTTPPPDLPILCFGRVDEWKHYVPRINKQDLVFVLGHVKYPRSIVDSTLARGCQVVSCSTADHASSEQQQHFCLYIGPLDSCLSLPEYPIKILPTSAVVQALAWHSLMAETERLVNASRQ